MNRTLHDYNLDLMQLPLPIRSLNHKSSFGERRYPQSDLARFSLTLNLAREDELLSPTGSYPSPPMSGSPREGSRRSGSPQEPEQRTPEESRRITSTSETERTRWLEQQYRPAQYRPEGGYTYPPPPPTTTAASMPAVSDTRARQYQNLPSGIPSSLQLSPESLSVSTAPHLVSPFAPAPPLVYAPPTRATAPATGQRRSKAHVPSACVNCKKAHLACDVSRPCRRCVNSGKEDSCRDVQHKKRGRPRLRDGQSERAVVSPVQSRSLTSPTTSPTTYRHERVAYGPDQSLESNVPTPPTTGGRTTYPHPGSQGSISTGHPMALLTLDLIIVKASSAFYSVMMQTPQSLGDKALIDLVEMPDRQKVYHLKHVLKDERDRIQPAYLPPIWSNSHELDAIRSVPTELAPGASDIAGVVGSERREQLSLRCGDSYRLFNVSLRLARNQVYFVVLTLLPPSAPMPPPGPLGRRGSEPVISLPPMSGSYQPSQHVGSPYPRTTTSYFAPSSSATSSPSSYNPPLSRPTTSYSHEEQPFDYASGLHPPQALPQAPPPPVTSAPRNPDLHLPPLRSIPEAQTPRTGEVRKRAGHDTGSTGSSEGLEDEDQAQKETQRKKSSREKKRGRMSVRDVMD